MANVKVIGDVMSLRFKPEQPLVLGRGEINPPAIGGVAGDGLSMRQRLDDAERTNVPARPWSPHARAARLGTT
jgi:hypothetical protein